MIILRPKESISAKLTNPKFLCLPQSFYDNPFTSTVKIGILVPHGQCKKK